MSERHPMFESHECSGDAAAYVLGALEADELEAFRRHMASCVVCRDEVAAFEQVTDVLPASVPQYHAPKSLRRRVMQAAEAEPRKAPEAPPRARRRPFRSIGLIPRPAFAAATGFAAVVAVVLALTLGGGGSSGAHVFQASVGSAEVRVSAGRAELIVRHLPAPPAGKIYEVWLQHGNRAPTPTKTLFSVTSGGTADVGVVGSLHGVSRVMVTPERAGGSSVPTHAPVIVAQLS